MLVNLIRCLLDEKRRSTEATGRKDRKLAEAQKAFDKLSRQKIMLGKQARESLEVMGRLRPAVDQNQEQECIKMKFVSKLIVPKSIFATREVRQQVGASSADYAEDFASTSMQSMNERWHEPFDVSDSLILVPEAEDGASSVQIEQSSNALSSRPYMESCFGKPEVPVKPSSDTPQLSILDQFLDDFNAVELNQPPPSRPYNWAYHRYLMGEKVVSSLDEIWGDYQIN